MKQLVGLILLLSLSAKGQEGAARYLSEFTKLSIGASQVQFRDFATSPLVYSGSAVFGDFGSYTVRGTAVTEYGSHFVTGGASDPYGAAFSSVTAVHLYYGKLYQVAKPFKYGQIHVGGFLEGTGLLRTNNRLMNNGLGIELAPALYASGKLTRDVSRKRNFVWQPIPFLSGIRFKERSRTVSFRLNAGLVNGGYRNGYAYSGQSALLNNFELFEDYTYNATAGLRFSGECSLTTELGTKNRIEYSYYFQQFALNGYDRFEWMQQGIKMSIYFLTKHKEL